MGRGVLMRPQHTCRWSLEEDWSKRCPGIHTLILNQHISKWLPALRSLENPEEMERNGFKHMFSFCSFQKTVRRRQQKASSTCENSFHMTDVGLKIHFYDVWIKVITKDVTKILPCPYHRHGTQISQFKRFVVLACSLKVDKISL